MRCFLAAGLLEAAASQGPEVVRHLAPALPAGWMPLRRTLSHADGGHNLTISFAVREQNLGRLEELAMGVSDPQSPEYGKYLSVDEIQKLTQPSSQDVHTLQHWLNASGIPFRSRSANGFEVNLTVEQAEALFQTQFYQVHNIATEQRVLRAASFSLPKEVDAVVTAVYGIHGLPLPPRKYSSKLLMQPYPVTPSVLEQTYNVSGVSASGSTKNRQAVAEFQGQTMSSSDLKTFFEKFVGKAGSSIYKFVGDDGEGVAQVEPSLDVDYLMGVAPGVLTEFWYFGSNDFCVRVRDHRFLPQDIREARSGIITG